MPISTINQNGLTNPLTSVAANTVTSAAATALTLQSAGTTAVTISTAQNVGIGTTSPTGKLDVSSSSAGVTAGDLVVDTANKTVYVGRQSSTGGDNSYLVVRGRVNGSGTNQAIAITGDTTAYGTGLFRPNNDMLGFSTLATERMRIDSSGNVVMGHTAWDYSVNGFGFGAGNSYSYFTRTSGFALGVNRKTTSGELMAFWYNNSGVGNVSTNGSNCTFNSTSDYRLKQNIQPMTGALARVAKLKPVTYNWIRENQAGEGFIAHELQEVVPEAVTGTKDAVDEEGNPVYQAIDQSVLVATLTAAIQELKAEFDAYKASHP